MLPQPRFPSIFMTVGLNFYTIWELTANKTRRAAFYHPDSQLATAVLPLATSGNSPQNHNTGQSVPILYDLF